MFRNKRHLKVVLKEIERTTTDAAWLDRFIDCRWDHDYRDTVRIFLKNAWLHGATFSSDPAYFAPLLTELKPRVEHALAREEKVVEKCYIQAIAELMQEHADQAARDLPNLQLQRAVAIAIVFPIPAGVREILINFMRRGDVEPVFGFAATCVLAKSRTKSPVLMREELVAWMQRLLAAADKQLPPGLIEALALIGQLLGNDT
jgi:hypothetical protein